MDGRIDGKVRVGGLRSSIDFFSRELRNEELGKKNCAKCSFAV